MTEMKRSSTVVQTDLGNYYGALELAKWRGKHYLRLNDWSGYDHHGPLSKEQLKAFYVLFELEEPSDD